MKLTTRWRCVDENITFDDAEALLAEHPFIENGEILGCPSCRDVDLVRACSVPNCNERVASSTINGAACQKHKYLVNSE